MNSAALLVFIGTYTRATSRGIYALSLNPADGTLSDPWLAAEAQNPTFLAYDPSRHCLYATGDIPQDPPTNLPQGAVSAFSVGPASGQAGFINRQATGDGATSYVSLDATGRMAIAVSYGGGTVIALPVGTGGRLDLPSARFVHRGPAGPNHERQERPHAHSVVIAPDNRFALVCDLGLDRIFSYRIDLERRTLVPNEPFFATAPAGSGPRHGKFSGDSRFFYVANEMGGSVCMYAYDSDAGTLSLRQTISTLPGDFRGLNTVGEICLHPNGRFVYVSNRGHESLVVFARDPDSGMLSPIETVSCGGRHPRHFSLPPDGRWLLCANRDTDNVVLFAVDPSSGRITPTGKHATVSQPVCVLF